MCLRILKALECLKIALFQLLLYKIKEFLSMAPRRLKVVDGPPRVLDWGIQFCPADMPDLELGLPFIYISVLSHWHRLKTCTESINTLSRKRKVTYFGIIHASADHWQEAPVAVNEPSAPPFYKLPSLPPVLAPHGPVHDSYRHLIPVPGMTEWTN